MLVEGQNADFSIDIVMESKGKIHDWGWSVEVKIPFKSLRYEAGEGKSWGFNATRSILRLNNEFNSWMPQDRNIQGFLVQNGEITGLTGIDEEQTLEVIPSVTFSETGRRVAANENPDGRFINEPIKTQVGVNIKYNITPNITFDAAVNPDFAEVEADAAVVTANQRFPIFFPEKRPFFLEGAETFQSPLFLFNSRTIIDPDVAAKLTGKSGRNSFGFLVASDNAPGNYDEDTLNDPAQRQLVDEFVERNATFAVARVKRDFGVGSNVGFFGTARVFPENRNFVAGVDGVVRLTPTTTLDFQGVATTSRQCVFEPFFDDLANPLQATRNSEICGGNEFARYRTANGFGYYGKLSRQTETTGIFVRAIGRSNLYRAETGFTPRTDQHWVYGVFRKTSKTSPEALVVRKEWRTYFGTKHDGKGRMQELQWNTVGRFELQKNTNFSLFGGVAKQSIFEDEFGLARNDNRDGRFFGEDSRSSVERWVGFSLFSNPLDWMSVSASASHSWDEFDFDFGAGPRFPRVSPAAINGESRLDPGIGNEFSLRAQTDITPTDKLRLTLEYRKLRLSRKDTGLTAFNSNIYGFRGSYQFSRFISARTRVDYNTLRSRITGQYVFGWTPSPGKSIYVGYNDNSNLNGFNPFSGVPETGFKVNQRTFFIRTSYLFRKSF